MSSHKAFSLKEHDGNSSWEKKIHKDHAVWCQLGGDGNKVKVGLRASLLLGDRIAHC